MNKSGIDETIWQAVKAEAKTILIERAKRKELPIAYSELAKEIHSFHFEPRDPRLYDLLGDISTEEYVAGRGMLSALVVLKDELIPGQGFFVLAKKLGYDTRDQVKFWTSEIKRVHSAWKKP